MARTSTAHLDRLVGGVSQLAGVAPNWTRTVQREDSNGTSLAGALLEPSAENKCLQNRTLGTTWTPVALTSLDTNGAEGWAADIADYADGFVGTAVDTQHGVTQAITLTAATWVIWCVAEAGNKDWLYISDDTVANATGYFDLSTAAKGTMGAGVEDSWCHELGDGRVLCGIAVTGTAASHTIAIYSAHADGDNDFAGDASTTNTFVSDVQVELAAAPSSSITTVAAAVTRAADGDLEWDLGTALSGGEGSFSCKVLFPVASSGAYDILYIGQFGGGGNYLKLGATSGTVHLDMRKSGGVDGDIDLAVDILDGSIHEIQFTWEENLLTLEVFDADGVSEGDDSDTTCDVPAFLPSAILELKPWGGVTGEVKVYSDKYFGVPQTEEKTGLHRQSFYSWLLAYGDTTNIARSQVVDSTGSGYNTIKGIDPQSSDAEAGGRFSVADASDFPSSGGEDSFVYVGKETMWYGARGSDSFGTDGDATDLLRGRFGSLNSEHAYNPATRGYPEATDHPTCWNGRWVRWWMNAIDPITGYPFPMSTAVARLYAWGSHSQELRGNRACWVVNLARGETLLKAKVPSVPPLRVKGINIGVASLAIRQIDTDGDIVTNGEVHYTNDRIVVKDGAGNSEYSGGWWKTAQDLVDDLGYRLIEATANWTNYLTGSVQVNGGRVFFLFGTKTGYSVELCFNDEMGAILGFEPNTWHKMTTKDGTFNTNSSHYLEATKPTATAFVGWMSGNFGTTNSPPNYKVYVEDDDYDSWGDFDQWPMSQYALATVGSGDKRKFMQFKTWPDATDVWNGSDSDGDYVRLHGTMPPHWSHYVVDVDDNQAFQSVYSTLGATAPTIGVALSPLPSILSNFFIRVMTSTGYGTNGTDDLYPKGCGIGIRADLIDTDTWHSVAAMLGAWRQHAILEPTSVLDLLEEELRWVTGIILRQDNQGRFVIAPPDIPSSSDNAAPVILDEHWKHGASVVQQFDSSRVVNRIISHVDYNPLTGKYMSKLEAREPNSIQMYGEQSTTSKHQSIRTDIVGSAAVTASNPDTWFPAYCQMLFYRYGFENPVIRGRLTKRGLALFPGDGVWVSHDLLQDPRDQNAVGISYRAAEVQKIDKDDVTGECTVELLCDGLDRKFGGYAPAAIVSSYADNVITTYTSQLSNTTDASFFTAADTAVVYENNNNGPAYDFVTVDSVSGNQITLTANTSNFTPADGDILVWQSYSNLVAAQKAKAYVAVSDGTIVVTGVDTWRFSP